MRTVVFLAVLALGLPLGQLGQAGVVSFGPAITDDASTGISTSKAYTHTVSGGEAVSVNGVSFALLNSGTTPPDFAWDPHGKNKAQVTNNNGDWNPGAGGVTGPEIQGLLNDFAYSGSGDVADSHQSYTLSGLTLGTPYEARLYIRMWDDDPNASGRPIDLTFTHGAETDTESIMEDRAPDQGYPSLHSAYYLSYAYTAQGTTLTIDAAVPHDAVGRSGSLHLYALSNEDPRPRDAIPGLFNTGVDNSGVPLPNNDSVIDPHYQITTNPNGTGPDAHVEDETQFPIVAGPWLANSSTSKWIAPEFDTEFAAAGDYVYEMLFDLSGFFPETAMLSGQWASDNAGLEILLNGVSVSGGNAGFGALTPFSIPIGGPFIEGMNTLAFRLNNETTGYTALRVEGLEGSAVPIPEPTTLALLGLGGLLSLARRRRRSA